MQEYATKLSELAKKKQRLLDEEDKLIKQRKADIADLAERLTVLTVPDEIIAGVFVELSQALTDQSHRLKEWETQGARFLKLRKSAIKTKASNSQAKKATASVSAHADT